LTSIKKQNNRIFALYLIVAAIWSFTSFMLHLSTTPKQALFWNEALAVALIWTLITYYHFIRVYTNRTKGIELFIGYLILFVFAFLSFKGHIIKYAYVVNGVLYHNIGNGIYAIGVLSITPIVAGLYLLIRKYRGSTDPSDRNRTMYLIAGWSIITLFSYSNLIPAVAGFPLDHFGSLCQCIDHFLFNFQVPNVGYQICNTARFSIYSRAHTFSGFIYCRIIGYFQVLSSITILYHRTNDWLPIDFTGNHRTTTTASCSSTSRPCFLRRNLYSSSDTT